MMATTETLTSSLSTSRTPSGNATLAVALMSFAALLLELGLTRLFSVVLFYHFAFLAISIALLGLGAGAVFACLRGDGCRDGPSVELGARLCFANALCHLRRAGDRGAHGGLAASRLDQLLAT